MSKPLEKDPLHLTLLPIVRPNIIGSAENSIWSALFDAFQAFGGVIEKPIEDQLNEILAKVDNQILQARALGDPVTKKAPTATKGVVKTEIHGQEEKKAGTKPTGTTTTRTTTGTTTAKTTPTTGVVQEEKKEAEIKTTQKGDTVLAKTSTVQTTPDPNAPAGTPAQFGDLEAQAKALQDAVIGANMAFGIVGVVCDLVHPFKALGAMLIIQRVIEDMGLSRISRSIITMPIKTDLLTKLQYFYNAKYTPKILDPSQALEAVTEGEIDQNQYIDLMALNGYGEDDALTLQNVELDKKRESDRLAAARAAGLAYTKGNLTEAEFKGLLAAYLKDEERVAAWLFRYRMALKQKWSTTEVLGMAAAAL